MSSQFSFRGFSPSSGLDAIVRKYKDTCGVSPTLIVLPAGYVGPTLIRGISVCRSDRISIVLATHETQTWTESESMGKIASSISAPKGACGLARKRTVRRPLRRNDGPGCPHCGQELVDFNELGWWHGWREGQPPPYWGELCDFVYRRDERRCVRCGATGPKAILVVHHIRLKERRGPDSARNLVTLCRDCHARVHDTAECGELLDSDRALIAN